MARINNLKLKALKQTRAFYIWELKRKESLTEKQKDSYLLALESIGKIIKKKELSGEKEKHKKFMAYDHKAIFQNSKRGY